VEAVPHATHCVWASLTQIYKLDLAHLHRLPIFSALPLTLTHQTAALGIGKSSPRCESRCLTILSMPSTDRRLSKSSAEALSPHLDLHTFTFNNTLTQPAMRQAD
jgi:hypothetical protein